MASVYRLQRFGTQSDSGSIPLVNNTVSLNGVFVNGIRLKPLVPHTLIPDDIVQLGIRLQDNTDAEFQYIFLKDPWLTPCHEQDWSQNKDGKTCKTDFVEESSCIDQMINPLSMHLQATSSAQILPKQTRKILEEGQQGREVVGQNSPEIGESGTNDRVNDGVAESGVMNQGEREEFDRLQDELKEERKKQEEQARRIEQHQEMLEAKTQQKEAACRTMDVMESELQCSICSELFIQAMTLNCSHTFCSHCINEWRKRKAECPVCRAAMSTCTPSLAINLCVEHIVQERDEDIQRHRRELLAARTRDEEDQRNISGESSRHRTASWRPRSMEQQPNRNNHRRSAISRRTNQSGRGRNRGGSQTNSRGSRRGRRNGRNESERGSDGNNGNRSRSDRSGSRSDRSGSRGDLSRRMSSSTSNGSGSSSDGNRSRGRNDQSRINQSLNDGSESTNRGYRSGSANLSDRSGSDTDGFIRTWTLNRENSSDNGSGRISIRSDPNIVYTVNSSSSSSTSSSSSSSSSSDSSSMSLINNSSISFQRTISSSSSTCSDN
uniref:E3 ubiquitin-protein ligase RNF8 isoform X2 n=1 Tax=Myxine glutinosa TaxID=7769 RepID=UPI00358F326D